MQAQGDWPIQDARTYGGKMKTCRKCGETKPFTEFYKKSSAKDGYQSQCKVCAKKYLQENKEATTQRERRYREENKETIAERNQRWYQENKEAVLERTRRYYQKNKEAIRERDRHRREEKKAEQPGCVYQIVNSINARVYVGETIRGELRWIRHLKDLRRNRHQNPNLQADFNEFGEEAFEWSIIQELPKDKEVLEREETNTIERLLAEGKELYNVHKN